MTEKSIEAKAALDAHNGNQTLAAQSLGIARSTFQERLKKLAQTGNDGLSFKPVPFGHTVKGVSTYYDKDGVPRGQWQKTRVEGPSIEDLVEYFKDSFKDYKATALPVPRPLHTNLEIMTVYPIADLHIGMLAWPAETGQAWDLKIAEQTIVDGMTQLVMQSQPSQTAIIANLGDYFHINDSKNMTPGSGNLLDVDSRYQKIIYTGVRVMRKLIDLALQKHEQVIVRNVKGNHDPDATVALNVALAVLYENNPRVEIDDSPAQFSYLRFGTNLIGMYHGHTCKPEAAAMKMACENAVDWGKSVYRYMMHGHYHQEAVKEVGNVRVEGFQTAAAKDEYAASRYCSGRSLQAITFHETKGEVGRHRVNL